ncbi:MAG: MlaD family protein [Actinomycetota bacterium]|nr:MlaD family protein [Actinomycetota bacterium]
MTGRRRPTASSFAVGAAVLIVSVIVVWLGFSKDVPLLDEPFEIKASFRDTGGINKGSPVRIAGKDVGKVSGVERTSPGAQSATVTLAIAGDDARPIHNDASAKIRPRIFLEGNFFVDLSPGSASAGDMDGGDTIPAQRTSNPVQFDQVLAALRGDTRNDLRQVFTEIGIAQDRGGAKAFNDSLRYQPNAYKLTAIVSEALLGKAPGDLGDWVRDQGIVSEALEADPAQLRALIVDFNATAGALADRESALRASVAELPLTLRAALPTLDSLNRSLPDVRRFAVAARPGVRSLGPTVDSLLPLVKQLRGLVAPAELRGLARDLRGATPSLARVAKRSVPVLQKLRAFASCTAQQLVPFGNDKLVDQAFPSNGPVYQEAAKFLPGLAGESRSFDANGQYFKVLGTGGLETFNLGNGLFGSTFEPIVGNNPPPVRARPPLRPHVPCETQAQPDLRSIPNGPPTSVNTRTAAVRSRAAKSQEVAIAIMRELLALKGSERKVRSKPITIDEIRRIAQRNGLTAQLDRALRKAGG